MRLLVRGASQIVQIVNDGRQFLRGAEDMKTLSILEGAGKERFSIVVNGYVRPSFSNSYSISSPKHYLLIIFRSGLIEDLGTDSEIAGKYPDEGAFKEILEAEGKSVIPGLVDGHTHPVWAGDRVHEFAMKV